MKHVVIDNCIIVGKTAAAEYLGVNWSTVKRMIDRGEFPEPDVETKGTKWVWTDVCLDGLKKTVAYRRRYDPTIQAM